MDEKGRKIAGNMLLPAILVLLKAIFLQQPCVF